MVVSYAIFHTDPYCRVSPPPWTNRELFSKVGFQTSSYDMAPTAIADRNVNDDVRPV